MSHILHRALAGFCDLLMTPFATMNPWVGLAVLSFLISVLAMAVYKVCSNPAAIARARNRAVARVLELRLFKDDLAGIFGAFGRILGATGGYVGRSLVPLAVLIVPVSLFLVQMAAWFEFKPLNIGETTIVAVSLPDGDDTMSDDVVVSASPGFAPATEVLRIPSEQRIVQKFRVLDAGEHFLDVSARGSDIRMEVITGSGLGRINASQVQHGALLSPGASYLPEDTALSAVEVQYPPRELTVAGVAINWILASLVLALAFGLLLKPVFRVEF
jgi:hypothetical protein